MSEGDSTERYTKHYRQNIKVIDERSSANIKDEKARF